MNTRIAGVGRVVLSSLLCLMVAVPPSLWASERDLQVVGLRERATLWVLTVGVSKYADDRIDLQYADNDAKAIAQLLATQTGRLFREVHTHVLVNENATRVAVLRAMSEFLGQASSEDVVVIFLAGHGLQDRATGTYYFVPFDANSENLLYAGLPMSMFDEAVQRLRRNVSKIVLWLDTCHAGAMNVSATRGVNAGEDLSVALSEASGDYVLSASKAGEESLEDASWELDGEAHGGLHLQPPQGAVGCRCRQCGRRVAQRTSSGM